MSRLNIFGWALMTIGFALWIYGYFVTGHASLIDWRAMAPDWISEFLPNIEAELGIVIMLIACFPTYWPHRREPVHSPDARAKSLDRSNDSTP